MEGYKVFEPDWTCRGFQYEVGKTFEEDVTPSCCNRGFHFCKELKDCFNYHPFNPDNKVAKVIALGEIDEESDDSKCCINKMEVSLVNAMSRETILRQYLDTLKGQYSHILIDCQPSLGMLTVNALAAANRIIIPVQAEYLPAKGLEQLLSTVSKVKRQIDADL